MKLRMDDIFIVGGGIFQDRSYELIPNFKQVYPYVDAMVMVNGGDTEGWVDKVKALDTDNKLFIIDFPWIDNFPLSRQKYLDKAKEITPEGKVPFFCRFDSDEFLSTSFLERMRFFIKFADQKNCNALGIRSYDITVDRDGNEVSKHMGDFHKMLVYWVHPHLQYTAGGQGFVHEGYNFNHSIYQVPSQKEEWDEKDWLCYRHIKTQGDVWMRAQRNFFIRGGGPNRGTGQPLWEPFREMLNTIMPEKPKTYHDYLSYLKEGKVSSHLKDWFILHMFEGEKNKPQQYIDFINNFYTESMINSAKAAEQKLGLGYDGASEVKEGYKLYFRWLHPEEEPQELKELSIP